MVDEFLKQLADRLRTYDSEIIAADETADWPQGKLGELLAQGILSEIEPSRGVVCDQCEENCTIEPEIRTIPKTGKAVGVFVCTRPDIGRIEVDLNRLRQWRIDRDKLQELGYCADTGPQPEDELITVGEASDILGVDKGTASRLVTEGRIKHNGETGKKKRVSKISVLLLKEQRERERVMRDFAEYRKDIKSIPEKHE